MIIFQEIEDYVLNESIRSLVRETVLTTNDFVMPMFVMEGEKHRSHSINAGNFP